MKLHDLRPADGSHTARMRVGRGIAAGKGKTAGRGTKGQKARAGGSIPPWFEGGQTPLHMRIPKLRGFRNRAKIHYEVVNVGAIAQRIEAGAFAEAGTALKKGEQLTINADILRAVGLVRDVKKPLKVLGGGELATALFVVADAFTKSATHKIEAAGGAVSVLEVPTAALPALGVDEAASPAPAPAQKAAPKPARAPKADSTVGAAAPAAETPDAAETAPSRKRAPKTAAAVAEAADDAVAPDVDPATAAAADPTATNEAVPTPEPETDSAAIDGDESA